MTEETKIGLARNYYGGIVIKKENGKFFWMIYNYDSYDSDLGDEDAGWEKIPEELYCALFNYQSRELGKRNWDNKNE